MNTRLSLTLIVRDAATTFALLEHLSSDPNVQMIHYEGEPVPYDSDFSVGFEEDDGCEIVEPEEGTLEADITPAQIEKMEEAEDAPVEWPERDAAPILGVTYTVEDAVAAARKLGQQKDTATLVKLLAEFNIKRVSELPADLFGPFVERAEGLLS